MLFLNCNLTLYFKGLPKSLCSLQGIHPREVRAGTKHIPTHPCSEEELFEIAKGESNPRSVTKGKLDKWSYQVNERFQKEILVHPTTWMKPEDIK